MASLALGIDLGTSYFKIGVFDRAGQMVGLGRVALPKQQQNGQCELNVDDFWDTLRRGIALALARAGAKPDDVHAVGYSSQANSFIFLNEAGLPLIPLVLWPDQRANPSEPHFIQLWRRKDFLQTTGLGLESIEFAVNKWCWFQRHQPQVWKQTRWIQTISDYLVFGLTEQRLGDAGTSAMLGLWDLAGCRWWSEGLSAIGLTDQYLSTPLLPGTVVGKLSEMGAQRVGLTSQATLVVGGLDHYVAALGAGIGPMGDLCESTGTVLACLCLNRDYVPRPQACMGPGHDGTYYYQIAFNESGAAGLEWYQRYFAPELSIPELLELAAQVSPGCAGLEAQPEIHHCAPANAFINEQPSHGHGHRVRAILEMNARELAELVKRLQPIPPATQILATGGGARSKLWLQIKADILGLRVVRSSCEEPACRGAAMFAAVAAGFYPSLDDVTRMWIAPEDILRPSSAFVKKQ